MIDWAYIWAAVPDLMRGLGMTLIVSFLFTHYKTMVPYVTRRPPLPSTALHPQLPPIMF